MDKELKDLLDKINRNLVLIVDKLDIVIRKISKA